jgi:hypothetical protein
MISAISALSAFKALLLGYYEEPMTSGEVSREPEFGFMRVYRCFIGGQSQITST